MMQRKKIIQGIKVRLFKGKVWAEKAGNYTMSKVPSKAQTEEFAKKTKVAIDTSMQNLSVEKKETEEMAKSFFKLLESKLDMSNRKEPPTEEEVKAAIEQLKDIGRISVFATISILPGGGFSLIGLELLARKYGIKNFTIVPSSFRKKKKKKEDDDNTENLELPQ